MAAVSISKGVGSEFQEILGPFPDCGIHARVINSDVIVSGFYVGAGH